MTSLAVEFEAAQAKSVRVTDRIITVQLTDGRTVTVPTSWYPRLLHATTKERANYEIDSVGVSWPDVEADFSIRGILLGRKSDESRESFNFWLKARRNGKTVTVEDYLAMRGNQKRSSKAKHPTYLAPANITAAKYDRWFGRKSKNKT
jgi:hypothetical protein